MHSAMREAGEKLLSTKLCGVYFTFLKRSGLRRIPHARHRTRSQPEALFSLKRRRFQSETPGSLCICAEIFETYGVVRSPSIRLAHTISRHLGLTHVYRQMLFSCNIFRLVSALHPHQIRRTKTHDDIRSPHTQSKRWHTPEMHRGTCGRKPRNAEGGDGQPGQRPTPTPQPRAPTPSAIAPTAATPPVFQSLVQAGRGCSPETPGTRRSSRNGSLASTSVPPRCCSTPVTTQIWG